MVSAEVRTVMRKVPSRLILVWQGVVRPGVQEELIYAVAERHICRRLQHGGRFVEGAGGLHSRKCFCGHDALTVFCGSFGKSAAAGRLKAVHPKFGCRHVGNAFALLHVERRVDNAAVRLPVVLKPGLVDHLPAKAEAGEVQAADNVGIVRHKALRFRVLERRRVFEVKAGFVENFFAPRQGQRQLPCGVVTLYFDKIVAEAGAPALPPRLVAVRPNDSKSGANKIAKPLRQRV